MKKILVTGGAGYIGSHAVRALILKGYEVVVVDNLSKGHQKAVHPKAVFVELDLADTKKLNEVFQQHRFDAVMHFAGSIEVGLSMKNPTLFFQNNFLNGLNLLEVMRENKVNKIIFSSTAAVYGNPVSIPIREDSELKPTNFYGESKLMFEQLLQKYDEFYGFKYVALRYFNAAGADISGEIGQAYEPATHIVPRVLQTLLGKLKDLKVYGTDYPTKDGTCIRDYIHVSDLIDAHLLALEYLFEKNQSNFFNLGNGNGFSVREVIDTVQKVTGKEVPFTEADKREGDPAVLVADSEKAKQVLGWKPELAKLEDIVASAWKWHLGHPNGYDKE